MKITKHCIIACMLSIFLDGAVNAQSLAPFMGNYAVPSVTGSLNQKAVDNFQKNFTEATSVKWQTIPAGSRVSFTQHYSQCRVDYNRRGKWLNTIKRSFGDNASADTRKFMAEYYPGYTIMYEMQVENWMGSVVIVKIENKTTCKTIRLSGDQYDTIEEFEKI